ncbi:GNAT family N-acetyltransferase [Agrococcus jejuensis]|uniref:GNAT family N-acetyltransferase n=1 Tax=Agrococcus jejuensis TaxID=399736 RepID=UPI0011AA3692|nr:GNAT family N-acetyltransferase [Agrococcus jejuensis]
MEIVAGRDAAATERILRSLPSWFGIEDALRAYVARTAIADASLVARIDGEVVGVALVERRPPETAELVLIAVHADHRGDGIGRALVDAAATWAGFAGASSLEVHTVGPSFDDDGYAATRAFYRSCGFLPVREVDGLDWDGPTLILVLPLAASVA